MGNGTLKFWSDQNNFWTGKKSKLGIKIKFIIYFIITIIIMNIIIIIIIIIWILYLWILLTTKTAEKQEVMFSKVVRNKMSKLFPLNNLYGNSKRIKN